MPKRALRSHLDDDEEELKIVIEPVAYSILEFCYAHRFSRVALLQHESPGTRAERDQR